MPTTRQTGLPPSSRLPCGADPISDFECYGEFVANMQMKKGNERLARFLRSLQRTGEIGGPPQGLTVERLVDILIRSAEGAKHDAKARGDRKALERSLRELALIAIAAMKT
jgi:hypothetical protein